MVTFESQRVVGFIVSFGAFLLNVVSFINTSLSSVKAGSIILGSIMLVFAMSMLHATLTHADLDPEEMS